MSTTIPDSYVIAVINGTGNQQASNVAAWTITYALAIITVSLRIWARHISKAKFWWDDFLAILALVVATFQYGICWWWHALGGGTYMGVITYGKLKVTLKVVIITGLAWTFGLTLVRISALFLLRRLFSQRWVRWYCWFWGVVSMLWFVASVAGQLLECQPTNGIWNRLDPGVQCNVDLKKFYLALALSGAFTDGGIILLPLVLCWRLQLSRTLKLLLTGIFATSFFMTIVTGIRIRSLEKLNFAGEAVLNVTWTFSDAGMWTVVELNMGIVSACLPCLRPVVAKIIPATMVPTSLRKRSAVPYTAREYMSKRSKNDTAIDFTSDNNSNRHSHDGMGKQDPQAVELQTAKAWDPISNAENGHNDKPPVYRPEEAEGLQYAGAGQVSVQSIRGGQSRSDQQGIHVQKTFYVDSSS